MKWFTRAVATAGSWLILGVLVVDAALVYTSLRTIARSNDLVDHTRQVLADLERFLSLLKDAETGQRGYILTGREDYLEPYRAAEAGLADTLGRLRSDTLTDGGRQRRIDELRRLADAKLAELRETIALRRTGNVEAALAIVRTDRGKAVMNRARDVTAEIGHEEGRLLAARTADSQAAVRWTLSTFTLTTGLSLLLLAGVFSLQRREAGRREKAAAAIRESEAWLSTTLASIGDALIATDERGHVRFMNPIAEALTGWPQAEAAGRPIEAVFRIFNESTRKPAEPPVERAIREGAIVGLANHTVLIARDGAAETPIEDSAAPIRDDRGAVVGVVMVFRDVTESRKAERAIREREERFRNLADVMPQIVWVTRPDYTVEYYNRRWFEFTGLTEEESYRPDGWRSPVHPDDIGPILDAAALSDVRGDPFEAEYRLRDRSGVYRWHLGRSASVFDEAGREVRRFGTATDIDDRKRAEHAARFLAEASATLAAIAAIADEAGTLRKVAELAVPFFADWCSVDMAGDDGLPHRLAVAHVDPSKVECAHELHRRYPPDPAASIGVPEVFRTGESQMIAEITDEMLVASTRDQEHLQILRDLGLRSFMCVPLKGRAGTLGAISFVAAESGRRYGPEELRLAEDLGRRAAIALENARLYGELKEADRRKDEFLATLAHELRNPLAPIRNALHLMRQPGGNGHDLEVERAMAERQVVHLARLIDDLMDVARISRGKMELQKEVVDLARIVDQAVETARPLIDERRHQLTVALPERPIRLEVDPTRLEQVLWNLLNNAAKYSDPGGQIRLTAEPVDSRLVLRVQDTGIGIGPEMLPRIFDMFVQDGDHRDHARGGLGIGLGLVRNLVEMHGGSIEARSEGPGRGSEFLVRLPVLPPAEAIKAPCPPSNDRRASGGMPPRRRILVVDDNQDAARSLAKLLTRMYGQDTRVAHDGPEALAVAADFRPALVLLDIGLPGMSGYEVAETMRRRPEFDGALIAALTGWGQEEDRRRSVEAGIDRHLVKPVNPEAILELLDDLKPAPAD